MNSRLSACIVLVSVLFLCGPVSWAGEPEIGEISFVETQRLAVLPVWIKAVEQTGGQFTNDAWLVNAGSPRAEGRLSITIDRQAFNEDLALVIIAESSDADLAVQLWDDQNRTVVLDVFGNVLAVGNEAKTDTFIVPLRKYPSATKIVLRRISGPIKLSGVVLFPVVTEADADPETLRELAKLLGDPLSPENSLMKTNLEGSGRVGTNGSSITFAGGGETAEAAPGILTRSSFRASSMNSTCFALAGIYQGRYVVHANSVEVWLSRADLYLRDFSGYRGHRRFVSLQAGLATVPGNDLGVWNIHTKSEFVPLDLVMNPGDRQILKDLHFSIPKKPTMDLSRHWLVFQLDSTYNQAESGIGYTYAHTSRDVFLDRR